VGPFETTEACSQWKEEYKLPFEVIPDKDGTIFKRLSNGWVPYSILVGPDGKVVLWESEFQEVGFVAAMEKFYQEAGHAPATSRQPSTPASTPSLRLAANRKKVDLLLAVPPHRPPDVVRSSGLIGSSGWIDTDPHTLTTEHEGVYAIGDVSNIRLANGKNLPKAGVFAHSEAEVVAERIATKIEGLTSEASFNGKGSCWLELGGGEAGFASGNFYAEPEPTVHLYAAGLPWHWGKVLFEKWWFHHWF
jgi:hypothetical protein